MCCIGRPGDGATSSAPSNATTGAETALHLLDNYGCSIRRSAINNLAVLPAAVTWAQRVVPLRANGIGLKVQGAHLGIGNALAGFVAAPLEQGTHLQSCLCHRASDVT